MRAYAPNVWSVYTLSRSRVNASRHETKARAVQLSGITPGRPACNPVLRPFFGDGGAAHHAVLDSGETAPPRADDDQRARRRPGHGSHDARPQPAAAGTRRA